MQYFDTPDTCVLDANNFSFRERTEDGDREVDLKYRSVDRYISSHQNMEGQSSRNPESKFEEDISPLPIFHIKYSLSTKQEIGKGKNLNKMDDPIGLYPGLESYDFNPNDPIDNVGNIIIHEFVYGTDAEVDLGSVDAELNLTLWYLEGGSVTMPVIAEISISYKDENEGFTEKVARRALQLFNVMQSLEEWNDPTSPTKTAFVYGYDPTWCAAQQMSLIQIGTRDQYR